MNPKEFFDKVVELREAQREYFRTRLPEALRKSKAIEADIDREISAFSRYKKTGKEPKPSDYKARYFPIVRTK